MARPRTPLIRLEEDRIEWRAKRRELMAQGRTTAALVGWIDRMMADVATVIDNTRMVTTIFGTEDGVYSETVARRFEEVQARKDFSRSA